MSITYVPVIQNNAPNFNVTTLNAVTVNTADLNSTNIISGVTGGFTANLTVGGTTNVVNLNAAIITAVELNIAASPAAVPAFKVRVTNDANPRLSIAANGVLSFGNGAAVEDTSLTRSGVNALSTPGFFAMGSGQSGGDFSVFGTSLIIGTAGGGLRIKEGANARMGVSTLAAGTVTVANTSVTATSRIQCTIQSLGTVTDPKAVGVTARVNGTSFTIRSADATDTSVIAWEIKEPA